MNNALKSRGLKMVDRFKNLPIVQNTKGLALVEFAFTAPVMLLIGMAGMETINLAVAHMQVSQIAMLVADNASRARESIDEADIREIFTGAHLTGESIDFSSNARIILSSLEDNGETGSDAGQWIRWQRCYGGNGSFASSYGDEDDGHDDATLADGMGPDGKKIMASGATAVNFAEVVFQYQPLVSDRFFGNTVIRYESAFVTRERDDHVLKNASSIPNGQLWKCDVYGTIDNPPS
ncbi:TadE family protein [Parasphingorhabdus sp.]|uniref:TadE/TadG family type IV pilus assembly protein n=1 Tax=Parasphingorhabdus sp. TaxID=2709688 RepID=UPI003263F3BE